MAIIINGKELSKRIVEQVKKDVERLKLKGMKPKLAVIMVGENLASKIYVRNKSKACNEAGIEYEEILLNENIKMYELLNVIESLNKRKDIHGILLQSPIPKHLDIYKAFETIDYRKDVDGLNPTNIGRLTLKNKETFISCTPHGITKMLEAYEIDLKGKNVVILGRSIMVGRPLAQVLLNKDATVTICHSKTENIEKITKNADILISAIGKPKFVKANMVKEGAIVIDVGINRLKAGLVGDVDFDEVEKKASYITPVPGGVGPMTIAMLLQNVIIATKYLEEK